MQDYKTTVEVAKEIGRSRKTIAQHCRENKVPGAKLKGHTWLVPPEGIKYLKGLKAGRKPKVEDDDCYR